MNCPDCGRVDVVDRCRVCGWLAPAVAAAETVSDEAIVLRQCPFRTGVWQCRLWRQSKASGAMCEAHRRSLRDGVRDLSGMLGILLELRETARAERTIEDALSLDDLRTYRRAMLEDGCSSEEALTRVSCYPFEWRPVEECWHLLTGQPLPPNYSPTTTEDPRHAATH